MSYTLESLIPDCVGRYITSESGTVKLSDLISGRTYAKCWQAFVYWVTNQFEQGTSSNLSPLGLIIRGDGSDKFVNAVTATDYRRQRPATFRFLNSFLIRFNLEDKPCVGGVEEADFAALRMNLAALSKIAGVDGQTFRIALTHLFRRIGEVLGEQEVAIDFKVGTLVSEANCNDIDFIFKERPHVVQKQTEATGFLRAKRQYQNELSSPRHNMAYSAADAGNHPNLNNLNSLRSPKFNASGRSTFIGSGNLPIRVPAELKDSPSGLLPGLESARLSTEVTSPRPPEGMGRKLQILNPGGGGGRNPSGPSVDKLSMPHRPRLTQRAGGIGPKDQEPSPSALPHTSVVFRRTLQGRSPLEHVRLDLETKAAQNDPLGFLSLDPNPTPPSHTRPTHPSEQKEFSAKSPAKSSAKRSGGFRPHFPLSPGPGGVAMPAGLAFKAVHAHPNPPNKQQGRNKTEKSLFSSPRRKAMGLKGSYTPRSAQALAQANLASFSPRKAIVTHIPTYHLYM